MLKKKHILVLFFFTLSAVYADFSSGANAYKKGDYKSAFNIWLPMAKNKSGVAQYNIGKLYLRGEGVEKNPEEALKWFKKSFKNGIHFAKKEIKNLDPTFLTKQEKRWLEKERSVRLEKQKLAEERKKLTEERQRLSKERQRLAEKKEEEKNSDKTTINEKELHFQIHQNATLINALALKYMKEEGLNSHFGLSKSCSGSYQVKKDCQKIFDWFWRSANEGYTYAQYILGLIHVQGTAHNKNTKSAKYWFEQSKTSKSQKIQKISKEFLKLLQD